MYELLIGAVVLTQVGDFISTYLALTEYNGREANPIVLKLMQKLGLVPGLLVAKAFAVAIVLFIDMPEWGLWALLMLYAYVLWNNFGLIYAAEKKRRG